MPLPYRALWSYIRYTLYFIAYTPFHPPQQPRPTPVSRIYPLSFFPPPFAPVVCSFSGCMHAVPRGAGYYAVGVASTTLLPLSPSLSLHLSVHIFLEHLCSSDARVRTSRAPADVGACAHARAGRAAKEKHFSGALLLSLLVSFSYVSPVPRYYPLINCQRWREREGEEEWKKSGVEEGRKGKARESSKGSVSTCATCCACARIRVSRAKWQFRNRDILA